MGVGEGEGGEGGGGVGGSGGKEISVVSSSLSSKLGTGGRLSKGLSPI